MVLWVVIFNQQWLDIDFITMTKKKNDTIVENIKLFIEIFPSSIAKRS